MQSLVLPPYSSKKLRILANLTTHPGRGRVGKFPPVPHHSYATGQTTSMDAAPTEGRRVDHGAHCDGD